MPAIENNFVTIARWGYDRNWSTDVPVQFNLCGDYDTTVHVVVKHPPIQHYNSIFSYQVASRAIHIVTSRKTWSMLALQAPFCEENRGHQPD